METISLLSKALPSLTFHSSRRETLSLSRKKRYDGKVCALGRSNFHSWDYEGRLVDESMTILRKRIHEMKMLEKNYEPPSDWTEWEKQYYTCYDEYICGFLGVMQDHLMNSRPSVALGMLALIAMSVPTSAVLLALQLMEAADRIIAATLLGA